MPILDILKKRKGKEIKEKKEKPKKQEVVKGEKKEEPKKPSAAERPRNKTRKKPVETYNVLKTPHITEKATDLTKENKYIFKVFPRTNKKEIKRAIEGLYNVDVVSVRIINIPPKRRRLGRTLGWRKGYKKAIIKIKEGQKIEVLPR